MQPKTSQYFNGEILLKAFNKMPSDPKCSASHFLMIKNKLTFLCNKAKKKVHRIRKKLIKMSLFANGMILYVENLKNLHLNRHR